MAENSREAELKITADASGVRAGVEQAKTALGDLSRSAEREGAKAGAGVEKAGDGANKAAAKIERETRNMIGSIERATAAFQAGERGSSGYFEALAKQRGISGDALKPYLEQLRQAEAIQKQATAGLGTMGVSAAQTAAALRQVPAQFTDIATSLASGQAPLTVFLQQGGQLKDAFGGAGAAARALGGYVLGLINPFTLAAAAVGGLGFAYLKGAAEGEAFARTLILTGNAAGVTAQQLSSISAAIAGSGVTQGAAADALNQLAATGKVGADNLGRFAAAAVQLQRVGGPAVEETVKAFAELGKDPLKASIKLDESTNFLTASLYKQIQALEEQGRATEAAKVAQEAFAAVIEDRFPKLEKNLGSLERLWLNIRDAASLAANVAKQIGRDETIDSLEAKIAAAQRRRDILASGGAADQTRAILLAEELRILQQQLATLKAAEAPARAAAEASAAQAKNKAAQLEADKALEALGIKRLTLAQEEEALRRKLVAAGREEEVITKAIAALRDKNKDKGAAAADRAALRALEQEASLLEKLAGLSGNYQKSLDQLQASRQRGAITEQQYVEAVSKLIQEQPFAVALAKHQADAEKQVAEAMARGNDLYLKKIDALNQSAESVAKQVQKLRDEEAALQIVAASNVSLAEAIELVIIKRLEEQQAAASGDDAAVAAIQREIDKRRELAQLIGSKEARDAAKKSADDAAKEWQRASADIERSLTDALLRGFESGKGFAETLRDTVVNMFKTMVLRPLLSPIVGSIGGALGLTGLSGLAAGAAGAAGVGVSGGLLGAVGLGGLSMSSIGSAIGAGFMNTIAGGTIAGGQAAGLLAGGASIGTGVAGLVGAALPWVGGAALIANGLGLFRSNRQVGAGITGQLGGTVEDFVVNRRGGSLFSGPKYTTPTTGVSSLNADLQATFSALREQAAGMAAALGLSRDAALQFRTAIGSEKLSDDTGGQGVRLEGLSAEQVTAKLQDELTRANERLASAVLGSAGAAFQRTGETASQTLERLAGSLTGVNGVLSALGQSLLTVGAAGGDTASKLLEQFGGLQQFQQVSSSYFEAFYSEAERTAMATQQLTAQLATVGVALPASREAYRQLVEAQDLNTESGRKAYAALLQLSPAFAQLVPATEALADGSAAAARAAEEAAARMAEAGRRVLADLAQQQGDLQVELLRAQGQTAAAADLERRNALAKLTEGLSAADSAAATAAFDLVASLRAQIQATNDAAAAADQAAQAEAQRLQAIASERAGLEQRLLQVQGDTAAIRALELGALDASNRAILERIYALQDEQAAQQQAAQAAQAEAQRLESIASERAGLERQLLQAQGNTAALRALELGSLDASNRAILERIYALQDEQAAAAAAAQQARELEAAQQAAADAEARRVQAIASERDGLINRLLQAEGNTAELRARELAGLDASNRALLERIFAIEDEKVAQAAVATAAQEAAQAAAEAARQAEQLRQAWQSVSDGIFDEVRRNRGLAGPSPLSLANAQSKFAITTAQARAGDQEAAKLLPGLSQTLLQMAEASATSLLDLQRIRAQIAASLEQTGNGLASRFGLALPKFDVGTNYVPQTMAAIVHEGEAIVPRRFNPAAGGGDSSALIAEVRGLREENKAQALSLVKLQTELNRVLKRWDTDGMPEERATA